jgi:DNA-binding XRE family transcriptional regulator
MAKSSRKSSAEGYAPVAFDPKKYAVKRSADDVVFAQAYEAASDAFAALDALLKARKEAGLTQVQVAARMGIEPASLARIEASLVNHRHSPSLETLRKYAKACGKSLEIRIA